MVQDLRFNRPSASSLPRLSKCPASWRLSQEASAQGMAPPAGEDADSGTRVHAFLSEPGSETARALTNAESDTAGRCQAQASELWQEWVGGEVAETFHEQRLYMLMNGVVPERATGDPVLFSGQADGVSIAGGERARRGFIWDFKTGPGEVEEAAGNIQLMSLAVLAAGRWDLKSVRVAIVQPLAGAPTVADYDEEALERARVYILEIVNKADGSPIHRPAVSIPGAGNIASAMTIRNNPSPIPGPHCRYCDARVICPALAAETSVTDLQLKAIKAISPVASPALISQALDALPLMKGFIEAVESVAKARLERGETIPGYCLKERKGKREIGDVMAAYRSLPLDPTDFIECCSASLPKLEEALKESGHAPTLVAAKKALADMLGDNLTQKTSMVLSKTAKEIE